MDRPATWASLSSQISSLTTLLYDSCTTFVHDVTAHLLALPAKQRPIVQESLLVITGTGGGLSRSLALYFASIGYTVMLQTPFSGQVSPLMARWSELKRQTSSTGSLVPLTFSSRDSESRAYAVKTLTAYARENDLRLVAILNCVDARGMRASALHYADAITGKNSSSHTDLPSEPIEAQKGALKKRKVSLGDNIDLFYQETPIPLGIATEEHLKDLTNEVLGVIGVVQDFLPLLRSTRGRVVNIWSSAAPIGFGPVPTGPLSMVEEAFKAASRTMALELQPFDVSVSIVLPSTTLLEDQGGPTERVVATPPTVSVTNDVRSVLTPSSSPAIRAVFDSQVHLYQKAAKLSAYFSVDERALWRVVRRAVEARYPKAVYPVGLDMIASGIGHAIIPQPIITVLEAFVWRRWLHRS